MRRTYDPKRGDDDFEGAVSDGPAAGRQEDPFDLIATIGEFVDVMGEDARLPHGRRAPAGGSRRTPA